MSSSGKVNAALTARSYGRMEPGVSRQRKLLLLLLKKSADETFDHLDLYVHRVRFSAGLGRLLKT